MVADSIDQGPGVIICDDMHGQSPSWNNYSHQMKTFSGHISVAEIYLTDLCEAEDAASVCKHHLDKAIETRPNSPEAHQLLASWCISMMDDDDADERFDQAKRAIKTAVGLWLPQYQVLCCDEVERCGESGPNDVLNVSF